MHPRVLPGLDPDPQGCPSWEDPAPGVMLLRGGHWCHSVPPVWDGNGIWGHCLGALRGLAPHGAGRGRGSPSWQLPKAGGPPAAPPQRLHADISSLSLTLFLLSQIMSLPP